KKYSSAHHSGGDAESAERKRPKREVEGTGVVTAGGGIGNAGTVAEARRQRQSRSAFLVPSLCSVGLVFLLVDEGRADQPVDVVLDAHAHRVLAPDRAGQADELVVEILRRFTLAQAVLDVPHRLVGGLEPVLEFFHARVPFAQAVPDRGQALQLG